jgi:hypothetical protein
MVSTRQAVACQGSIAKLHEVEARASALNTDLEWLREHTRYLQRAMEWNAGKRAANRLLSGPDIEAARAWASSRPKNAPEPTELQRDFIKASEAEESCRQSAEAQRLKEVAEAQAERGKALAERETAQKREVTAQKRFTRTLTGGLVIALSLAAAAIWLYFDARTQTHRAEAALAETERGLLRAQTAELRAMIKRLDLLKASAE